MASYVVLARKWRPAQFSDIVGQGPVVRTLINAIRSERIHQAYLFTGSRGIGKTSIARILAKAIRCEATYQSTTESTTNWLFSCGQCANCKEISAGTSIDVMEIDGASNNGVEAVREIRENAKYLPSSGSRKIYIIDEVHMLTTAAFNALLKTLEEPPAHVLFIFATTEPHKIPATILSRCQRFDFQRVNAAQIQNRLTEVIHAEGVRAEPAALALIARSAEGSMRDALSLLDQVIAFSGNELTLQSVRESVSMVEGETVLGILEGVFSRKPLDALAFVEQAYSKGHDLRILTRSLVEFMHGAILAKIGANHLGVLENMSSDEWKQLSSISEKRSLEELELMFQALHHGMEWIARSPHPKLVLDVLIVKCATAETLIYMDTQKQGNEGNSGSVKSPTPQVTQPEIKSELKAQTLTPVPTPVAPFTNESSHANQPSSREKPSSGPVSWENFIEHVRKPRPLLATLLEHGALLSLPHSNENILTISFHPKDTYFKEQLQSRIYNEQLISLSREYFGQAIRIQIELKEEGESLAARKERLIKARELAAREAAQNHPIIREAKALFGGELGPIELTDANI